MAVQLRLNIFAASAIAIGHDLGHTPFGHCGERTLNKILEDHSMPGFKHNFQSLLTVNKLDEGSGMNLMFETRDGILKHTGYSGIVNIDYYDTDLSISTEYPVTLEGQIVGIADEIAQRIHDTGDGLRTKKFSINDLLKEKIIMDCLKFGNFTTFDMLFNFKKSREILIPKIISSLSMYYVL
jgi:dGTPase